MYLGKKKKKRLEVGAGMTTMHLEMLLKLTFGIISATVYIYNIYNFFNQ